MATTIERGQIVRVRDTEKNTAYLCVVILFWEEKKQVLISPLGLESQVWISTSKIEAVIYPAPKSEITVAA